MEAFPSLALTSDQPSRTLMCKGFWALVLEKGGATDQQGDGIPLLHLFTLSLSYFGNQTASGTTWKQIESRGN
jgi:hypothetical protein